MVSVRINGEEAGLNTSRLEKMGDLIELIKSAIEPGHMISEILVDGRELSEEDWTRPLNQYGTSIFEINTDTPENFVDARIDRAAEVVQSCFYEFRDARKAFQSGEMSEGNRKLITAVRTAKAFFDWYASLIPLMTDTQRTRFEITDQVEQIAEVCKRICQQQLYQSWWALGETLEKELEPKLDKLEDFCRKFRKAV